MINVVTVHWKSRFFQDIQYENIARNIKDFRIWAFIDKVPKGDGSLDSARYFYHADSGRINHLVKLDMLADLVCNSSLPDDVILFMDGDAWPVAPIQEFIENSLKGASVGAVVRRENWERYPHPCFTFTTVRYWRESNLSWSKKNINHILHVLESRKDGWVEIKRTGGLSDHLVFFSIYGEMVYHHGGGFRLPRSVYCKKNNVAMTKDQNLEMMELFKKSFGMNNKNFNSN
jgi:hypothetical protein